jgi:hypothetical protein
LSEFVFGFYVNSFEWICRYLIFVFSCLCCHMKSSRAYYHIKKFWVFIVILAGLVLVARYVFQFEIVSSWLESIFPRNQCNYLLFLSFLFFSCTSKMEVRNQPIWKTILQQIRV